MTTARSWKLRATGGLMAAALLGAACGTDGSTATETDAPPAQEASTSETTPMADDMADTESSGDPTATPAAELRATLTAQLQEHVYLAGIAVYAAVNTPEAFDAAAAALDANTVELAASIGSVYGEDAEAAFTELWRTHIGFFVEYTNAAAEGDTDGMETARAALDDYRTEFGAFLAAANPELTKDAVAEELIPHVDSVFAAIDGVVAGDPAAFDLLREAAGHMPHTAQVLASAIAAQMPETFGS